MKKSLWGSFILFIRLIHLSLMGRETRNFSSLNLFPKFLWKDQGTNIVRLFREMFQADFDLENLVCRKLEYFGPLFCCVYFLHIDFSMGVRWNIFPQFFYQTNCDSVSCSNHSLKYTGFCISEETQHIFLIP